MKIARISSIATLTIISFVGVYGVLNRWDLQCLAFLLTIQAVLTVILSYTEKNHEGM